MLCSRTCPPHNTPALVRRGVLAAPARRRCKPLHAFEPHIGGPQLASASVVIASTVITGMYWWMVVVPSERASLAKSKRRGTMRNYLQEIKEDPSREAERWFYAEWLDKLEKREAKRSQKGAASSVEASSHETATTAAASAQPMASSTTTAAEPMASRTTTSAEPTASSTASSAEPMASSTTTTAEPMASSATSAGPMTSSASAEPMASSSAAPSNGSVAGGGNMPRQETQQPQQSQPQLQRDNLLQPTERTPEPNFLSLDNPVVFTAVLLGALVALSVAFH